MACRIVPQPASEPVPPAVEMQSPNHWTARELPPLVFLFFLSKFIYFILFIYFWLCWVFVAARGLSLVVANGLLCCGAHASRCGGFSCC